MKQQPLSTISYPLLRLTIESILEHWQEITSDDIYQVGDSKVKETAEYLSDLFAELGRRL